MFAIKCCSIKKKKKNEKIRIRSKRSFLIILRLYKYKQENFDGEANWLGVVNFHCTQMSRKGRAVSMTFFISGNDVIITRTRPLNFRVPIQAYSLRPQTYFRSSQTRVLNNQFRKKSSNTM